MRLPAASLDELDVLAQLEDHFSACKELAKRLVCTGIDNASHKACLKKWKDGRKEYKGKFIKFKVDGLNEILLEGVDCVNYAAILLAEA